MWAALKALIKHIYLWKKNAERIDVVRYLNELNRFGRKSFEWWDDSSLQCMVSTKYLEVENKNTEKVLVGIKCPDDIWFHAIDVAKFLDRCRKSWGNEAPILKANIVSDKRQVLYLVWSEDLLFWCKCEQYIHTMADLKKPSAKVIQMFQ